MKLSYNERLIFVGTCLLISLLTLLDILEDMTEGNSLTHILTEVSIIFMVSALGLYALRSSFKKQKYLRKNLDRALNESQEWKNKINELSTGLSNLIENQFRNWNLTPAESEVAWLLVKGLSHKEISEIRTTGEKTIRQQSATIYKKAGVHGRAELAALFIEDLLSPIK